MIDELNLDTSSYDHGDYVGVSITVENVIGVLKRNWALIAGIGMGELDLDSDALSGNYDSWWAALGVKWYMTPVTGISVSGLMRNTDFSTGQDVEIAGGVVEVKQRLLPASKAISPYVRGKATLQEVDHPANYLGINTAGSFTELIISALFGCDFMMNDEMAWTFEAGYSESEEFEDGRDTEDGFLARIAMRYYWE